MGEFLGATAPFLGANIPSDKSNEHVLSKI